MIKDSFWTDPYIEKLSPDEKLVFLYLLTNPLCNVAGVYEARSKRIGFETGYDVEVIENILSRFERDKKILRYNDWIVLVNHIKNQSLNPSIIQGCQRIFDTLPLDIGQRVAGWVQAGLLNLTLLNLTLPNSIEPSGGQPTGNQAVTTPQPEPENKILLKKYGEFKNVSLSDDDYSKLIEQLNENAVTQLITELDQYIASSGKKYKSHYATIQAWARRRINDHATKAAAAKKTRVVI